MAAANEALSGSFDKLSFAFAENLRTSRTWVMAKRLTVGSPFWKLANKISGINDGFLLYRKQQKKMMEQQKELTKATDDYFKVAEKIPDTGLFKRDGSALTDAKAKIEAMKIMEGEEFQNRLAFNERIKQAGGLKGMSAMDATKKQFDEMIKSQQDQLDAQLEYMVKEERYREMGFMGKIARQFDNIKKTFRALPSFLFKGIAVFGKLLFGFTLLVLFAPFLFKILRWGVGYVRGLTPEQRQKFANARDRIVDILIGVKDLMVAIFEGRFWDALKIYFNKILVPIGKGILDLVKLVGEFLVKKVMDLGDYILSGRLAEDIGQGIDKYLGKKGSKVKQALNYADQLY